MRARRRGFDVAVDLRVGSPTFGRWAGVWLSSSNCRQFYIPPGFAHGFCVTSEHALFAYKCTDFYYPSAERTLIWNDPQVGITWPVSNPEIAEKDRRGLLMKDFPAELLPRYEGDPG